MVMRGREFLHTPGPTNIPDRILNAMHRPAIDFASPAFQEMSQKLFTDLTALPLGQFVAFAEHGVTTMIADWTSNDERITRALAAFGRNSVPLYVLYPGKPGSSPQILPEVLTSNIVLDALKGVPASE